MPVLLTYTRCPSVTTVRSPLSTTTCPNFCAAAAAMSMRPCSSVGTVVRPISFPSRAISPGCGVSTACALKNEGHLFIEERMFSPSASTTIGFSSRTRRVSRASASGVRPSPGPMTIASAFSPASRSWSFPTALPRPSPISSGVMVRQAERIDRGTAT